MTISPIRHWPTPSTDGLEVTLLSETELTVAEAEFFAAMSQGILVITGAVLKGNDRINQLNQECLDKEAANPHTRTNYKGNL